jgi:hypothetical protein
METRPTGSSIIQLGDLVAKAKGWFGFKKAPRWVGIALILLGLIAMAGGIAGGIMQMLIDLQRESQGLTLGETAVPTGVIEVLVQFMQALAAAPQWLALIILGIFLVGWGASML